jgi:hypothetical protein
MNVIELAKQAGLNHSTCEFYGEELKAFAELVRADEREACADFLEHGYIDDEGHHLQYAKEIRARGEV